MEYDQKERTKSVQIYIIYKLVKHQKMKINCDFSTHKHLAYRSTYNDTKKIKHSCAW